MGSRSRQFCGGRSRGLTVTQTIIADQEARSAHVVSVPVCDRQEQEA